MSILKTFFFKFESVPTTLKYLADHINLTKFAFFPMKIFCSQSNVLCQNYELSIDEIDMSMSFKLQ